MLERVDADDDDERLRFGDGDALNVRTRTREGAGGAGADGGGVVVPSESVPCVTIVLGADRRLPPAAAKVALMRDTESSGMSFVAILPGRPVASATAGVLTDDRLLTELKRLAVSAMLDARCMLSVHAARL